MSDPADITTLLGGLSRGETDALERLMPLVYDELRVLAERALRRERKDHTLQTTALVHEAYLKLVDQTRAQWRQRAQFFAVAAKVMRRILVDHARAAQAAKRGGMAQTISLDHAAELADNPDVDLHALDEALTRLAAIDERQARIVELRFFGGMSFDEVAELIESNNAAVFREWTMAKAWLARELGK